MQKPLDPVRWTPRGFISRSSEINRLCLAFPDEREIILGLAELNPEKWPRLEQVTPELERTLSLPGQRLVSANRGPTWRIVWE